MKGNDESYLCLFFLCLPQIRECPWLTNIHWYLCLFACRLKEPKDCKEIQRKWIYLKANCNQNTEFGFPKSFIRFCFVNSPHGKILFLDRIIKIGPHIVWSIICWFCLKFRRIKMYTKERRKKNHLHSINPQTQSKIEYK